MTHFHLFDRDRDQRRNRRRRRRPGPVERSPGQGDRISLQAGVDPNSITSDLVPRQEADQDIADLGSDADLSASESLPAWTPRPDRRTTGEKFSAGLSGLKLAIRGDSSFFAHAYRALLIVITAAILGISPIGWCFLVVSAALVLIAEMAHGAVDTLARALGDPEEPGLKAAREIATAGVLVAAVTSAAITLTVLGLKLGVQLGWWD